FIRWFTHRQNPLEIHWRRAGNSSGGNCKRSPCGSRGVVLVSTRRRRMRVLGGGGGVVTPTYADKVLSIEPDNLVAYWQLNELEGSVALDSSENERHGVYTGVALDSADGAGVTMGRAGLWDTTDFCNIYSASLASAFNPSEGTAAIWFKVSAAGVWTDATFRRLFHLRVDVGNVVRIERATTNNRLTVAYVAGGTSKQGNIEGQSATDW